MKLFKHITRFFFVAATLFIAQNANAQVLARLASHTTPAIAESQCDRGNGEACAVSGWFAMTNRGQAGLPRAFRFFERSCNLNNGIGCFSTGAFYEVGLGVEKNVAMAMPLLEKSCTLEYDDGCIHLAFNYRTGTNVTEDKRKALDYYSKSCTEVRLRGCVYYRPLALETSVEGVHPLRQEVRPTFRGDDAQNRALQAWAGHEYTSSIPQLTRICENLRNYTCIIVGQSYYEGLGVTKDTTKAADYFEIACNGNIADGCNGLGNAHSHGDGRPRDFSKAMENHQKACDLGVIDGCFNVGVAHYNGEGIPKSVRTSIEYFGDSCLQRHSNSCYNLAVIFMQDDVNYDQDFAQAYLNSALAADPNNAVATRALADLTGRH